MQHFWKRLSWRAATQVMLAGLIGVISVVGSGARPSRAAGPWFVSFTAGNDTNDCLSANTACQTIGGVLAKGGFADNDVIRVAQGTVTGTGTEVVLINKSVQLLGGWNGAFTSQFGTTTIDGENTRAGIVVANGVAVTINRFTVRRAGGTANGGAGIYNQGSAIIEKTTFADNATGLYVAGVTTLQLSTVNSNTVGVLVASGAPTMTLRNTTVVYNTTGVQNAGGGLAINNLTIASNYAGGGLVSTGGTTLLQNSILSANGTNCLVTAGVVTSGGYNLLGTNVNSCFALATGDIQTDDPALAPLRNNGGATSTQALFPGSRAVNAGSPIAAGTPGGCESLDQREVPRPQLGICDIGAYESNQVIRTYLPRISR